MARKPRIQHSGKENLGYSIVARKPRIQHGGKETLDTVGCKVRQRGCDETYRRLGYRKVAQKPLGYRMAAVKHRIQHGGKQN